MIKGYRQDPAWKLANDSTATEGEARPNIIALAMVYSTLLPEEARDVFTYPKDMQ